MAAFVQGLRFIGRQVIKRLEGGSLFGRRFDLTEHAEPRLLDIGK